MSHSKPRHRQDRNAGEHPLPTRVREVAGSADRSRYRSPDEDSARWDRFAVRPGDVVVSARSKSGTTWVQTLCALLVHQTADLPAPLSVLSPWLDWLVEPLDEVLTRLDAQPYRRVVKTHTPLDGLPLDPRATYVVVVRHPLDAAVSLYHQGANIDRDRVRALTGQAAPASPTEPTTRSPLREWLLQWIDDDPDPRTELDSLPGFVHHAADAWARRSSPNVVLVHYDDLLADLEGQARRLDRALGTAVPEDRWPDLVAAATFDRMRQRADELVGHNGVLRDPRAFFRSGRSGAGRELLTVDELAHYHSRVAALAPPEVLRWLHHEPGSSGTDTGVDAATSSALPSGAQRVADALAALGVVKTVRTLPEPAPTAAVAAAQLGCEVGAIANSLVFDADGEPLLVLTSGAHRVDTERIAALTGVRAVRRATPAFVRDATGQPIGGVAPVGHPRPVRTLVDTWLRRHPRVWAAGGHPSTVFPTSFDELLRLTGGTAADVGD